MKSTRFRAKSTKFLTTLVISYPEIVYSKLYSASLTKLQVAFNYAARYAFNKRMDESISSWSKNILGMTIKQYLCARNCIFLHNLMMTKTPSYLYEKLCFPSSDRSKNLLIPKFNYMNSERLFFVNAIRLWNDLPANIKAIGERGLFKRKVCDFFQLLLKYMWFKCL